MCTPPGSWETYYSNAPPRPTEYNSAAAPSSSSSSALRNCSFSHLMASGSVGLRVGANRAKNCCGQKCLAVPGSWPPSSRLPPLAAVAGQQPGAGCRLALGALSQCLPTRGASMLTLGAGQGAPAGPHRDTSSESTICIMMAD
jgi:hypothetical protein